MRRVARTPVCREVPQGARGAADPDQNLAGTRDGQPAGHGPAHGCAQGVQLLGCGRIPTRNCRVAGRVPQGNTGDRHRLPVADGRDLKAPPADVHHGGVAELERGPRGQRSQARLLVDGQDLDVDAQLAPQGPEQGGGVGCLADRRRGHADDSGGRHRQGTEESTHGLHRAQHRLGRQHRVGSRAEPRLHPLVAQHAVAHTGLDPHQHEAHGVRAEVDERGHVADHGAEPTARRARLRDASMTIG